MAGFDNPDSVCLKSDTGQSSHPLLMDPVLQILFNLLEVADLKNCRLVTQEWAMKAFHTLKTRTLIKLDSTTKLNKFFKPSPELGGSSPSQKFIGFSIQVQQGWNKDISQRIQNIGAKELTVCYDLVPSQNSFGILQDLLSKHSKRLVKLDVTLHRLVLMDDDEEENSIELFDVPVDLEEMKYPVLKSLTLSFDYEDPVIVTRLTNLWINMIKNSANLKEVCMALEDVSFWSNLTSDVALVKKFETLDSLSLPSITPEITQIICRIPKLNLKRLTLKFIPGGADQILQRVANSLEVLKFLSPNESCLSPVNFPLMPKLKMLSSGNSQLSFPSITLCQLPALEELQVTYWDWVWTFEDLPDGHYYWRTDEPHLRVTCLVIRFPPLTDITGNYLVMENFADFSNRIGEKFPSLQTIRLKNMCNNPVESPLPGSYKVGDIVRSIGIRLKELSVVDYYKETESVSYDLMSAVDGNTCSNLETLDLNPVEWLKIWKGDERGQPEFLLWNLNTTPILNLRIAKLLWVSDLRLTELIQKLPNLEHLEIIGDCCINRFDRYEMRKLRPDLKFIQHTCPCSKEDVWYMSDTGSHHIFRDIFEEDAHQEENAVFGLLRKAFSSIEKSNIDKLFRP